MQLILFVPANNLQAETVVWTSVHDGMNPKGESFESQLLKQLLNFVI